jgi:cold shock CspA family protein
MQASTQPVVTFTDGVVTHVPEGKGFAFLYSEHLKRRVFFHCSSFFGARYPVIDQRVSYEIVPADKVGLPDKAINVRVLEPTAGINALRTMKTEIVAGVEVRTAVEGA